MVFGGEAVTRRWKSAFMSSTPSTRSEGAFSKVELSISFSDQKIDLNGVLYPSRDFDVPFDPPYQCGGSVWFGT